MAWHKASCGAGAGGSWLTISSSLPRTSSSSLQRMLEILGQDLVLLLSGSEAGPPLLPLGSSPPPLRGQPSPRPPTLPPEHRWLHLLRDLAKMQRRLPGRPKKAASLGCFGVKLDRIGTFSGLGC
ncbi:C-type natriuretic peptide 1-like [Python bivittatus]|uniref:C-type natriuretic peptide 1-like n=1 Tax=Python bivittatus TaxID=176946 RepID=A0A9F2REA7_PYTBI|nr:C-type natriuretic peptide 1-like [Python bivittatus]